MFEYLETLRAKPGHIRERIAFGTAFATTAVVAGAWLLVISASGTFTLVPATAASVAGSGNTFGDAVAQTKSGFTSLLGAAGASQNQSASGITVETEASTTAGTGTPTVLPF